MKNFVCFSPRQVNTTLAPVLFAFVLSLAILDVPLKYKALLRVPHPTVWGTSAMGLVIGLVLAVVFFLYYWKDLSALWLELLCFLIAAGSLICLEGFNRGDNPSSLYIVKEGAVAFFFYCLCRSYGIVFDKKILLKVLLYTMIVMGILQSFLNILYKIGCRAEFLNWNAVLDKNGIAIIVVCALFLFIMTCEKNALYASPTFYILMFFAFFNSYINTSRGGIVVSLFVCALSVMNILSERNKKIYATFIVVSVLCSAIITAFSYRIVSTYYGVYNGVDAICSSRVPESTKSALYRAASNAIALKSFIESPLYGVGGKQIHESRSGGYLSHTYYVFLLGAYGVYGLAVFIAFVFWLVLVRHRILYPEAVMMLGFLTMASFFFNNLWGWYGALIVLTPSAEVDE